MTRKDLLGNVSRFFREGGDGSDVLTLSLLVLVMTLLIIQTGVSDPVGMIALALQVGLLVRINYVHGHSTQRAKSDA